MMPKRGWCPPKPIVCGLGASTLEHAVSGGVTHSLDNLWSSSDVIPEVQLACQKGLMLKSDRHYERLKRRKLLAAWWLRIFRGIDLATARNRC
jgi:hypothetical protein